MPLFFCISGYFFKQKEPFKASKKADFKKGSKAHENIIYL